MWRLVVGVAALDLDSVQALVDLAKTTPEAIVDMLEEGDRYVVPAFEVEDADVVESETATPIVTAHGMGDSCFNPISMEKITKMIAQHMNAYAVCIPTGSSFASDTASGYLTGVEEAVDRFAKGIQADPKLAQGFDAVGFSQGNTLVRGYIHKYNNPPVRRFLSVHGTVSGVANVPGCTVSSSSKMCQTLTHALGLPAYTSYIQNHIFQAGYLRDPKRIDSESYKKHSVLAQWNNEGDTFTQSFKDNFVKVEKFVMVEALEDTMVEPKEGEHWSFLNADRAIVSMRETELYKKDSFGLQTVDKAQKIFFETTAGDHMQFSHTELYGWLDKYLSNQEAIVV
jgi:palmitoyl-protein thioesterase